MENSGDNDIVIIIGIEEYRKSSLLPVKYVLNDIDIFNNLMINDFGIPEDNIKIFTNELASRTALFDEVRYEIKQLNEKERLIFYYAGHGFYKNGKNLLTAWDTNPLSLEETSLSFDELVINPIKKSRCKQSLFFLDTCAEEISKSINSRSIIRSIETTQFSSFVKESSYSAIFFSCSPGQKSHSDDKLKNGIWTHYLVSGLSKEAIESRDDYDLITDVSLKKYLAEKVPKYISKNTNIRNDQIPYSIISGNKSILIKKEKSPLPRFKSSRDYKDFDSFRDSDLEAIISGFLFTDNSPIGFDLKKEIGFLLLRLETVVRVNNGFCEKAKEISAIETESDEDEEKLVSEEKELLQTLIKEYKLPSSIYFGQLSFIDDSVLEYWMKTLIEWIYGDCTEDNMYNLLNAIDQEHELDEIYIFYGVANGSMSSSLQAHFLMTRFIELGKRNNRFA